MSANPFDVDEFLDEDFDDNFDDNFDDAGVPIDTGVVAEVPVNERASVDGRAGSDALEGGDDSEAADQAFSRAGGASLNQHVDVEATAVRPYPFPNYQGALECTGAPSAGAGALLAWAQANHQPPGRSMGIYNCRPGRGSSTRSLRSEGRALDWGVPLGPTGEGTEYGNGLVDLIGSHAGVLGVQCIIYDRTLWAARSPEGRPYTGRSPHFDHLHIELTRDSAAHLTVDRLVEVLGGSSQRPAGIARPTVRNGDRGPTIWLLQQSLAELGHDPRGVDGIFGDNTESALRSFQRSRGLDDDGVAGSNVWTALRKAETPGPEPDHDDDNTDDLSGPDPAGEVLERQDGSADTLGTPGSEFSGPDPATDWESVAAEARFRHVMNRLVHTYEYPEEGAAGIVGNLWAESNILPNRLEGSTRDAPLRTMNFAEDVVDFTPAQIRDRDSSSRSGPRRPGVGLAQWTSAERRANLFTHEYQGVVHGADILFRIDAQMDYLVHELATSYQSVDSIVRAPDVTLDDAADEVVYRFEIPGRVLHRVDGQVRRRPRSDAQVQAVFDERRRHARRALDLHRNEAG